MKTGFLAGVEHPTQPLASPTFDHLLSGQVGRGGGDDYWAETFNSDKNCQQEKKISKLEKSDNGQCFTVVSIFLINVHT